MRMYQQLPRVPDAGLLTRYLETIGVIVPLARTNLITNPSLETNTTLYNASGASIARTTAEQYHGSYSLAITPTAALTDGAFYGALSSVLISGSTYAISCKIKGRAGVPYKFSVATTAGVDLQTYRFRGTGRWQWVWLIYAETATTSRRIYLAKDGDASTGVFYWDGLQIESCADGYNVPTTYIDGDQKGLVPNQYPPAYGWAGTPHASASYRVGQTRAGGRIVRLKDLGVLLTAIIGLGLAPPEHQALTFAQLDGGQYQNTIKPPRQFSLAARVAATTPNGADAGLSGLSRLLDRDRTALRQPLVLTTYATDCGVQCGEIVQIPAVYQGGLEGLIQELPTQQIPITFTQYVPYVLGHDQGVALDPQDSVANANGIIRRSTGGVWQALGTGVSGGSASVYALAYGLDGTLYVGGDFTNAGGSGADNFAAYNPTTNTWVVVGSATAVNGPVRAIAVGPDGRIYIGGTFTNVNGIANADGIAVWNPATGTWAALDTGTAGTIFALAFSPTGILYAGGTFTSIGASTADNIAQWDGSAWSNLASDTAINNAVESLAWGNGVLYVGGAFTNANGNANADFIATWSGSAWGALSTGMNADVLAIAVAPNGYVYAGGTFTTAGGVSTSRVAFWNGVAWAPLGTGADNTVRSMSVAGDGTIFMGGAFSTIGGLSFGSGLARWNGSVWTRPDLLFPGSAIVYALLTTPDGALYVGNDQSGTAFSAAATTAINNGTVAASPTLIISATTVSTVRINQLTNITTGQTIYFNLVLNAGEIATLTLDPTNITFVSTFRGNILGTILPGSMQSQFVLQPGANSITTFLTDPNATATLKWPINYGSLNDALFEAVAL